MQDYSISYGSSFTEEQAKDVRKTTLKSCKKAPVSAPVPRTAIKVYKVDPLNFRDLVQELTGAPEFKQPHQLQSVALAPTTFMPVSSSGRDISVATVNSSDFNWPPQEHFSNLYMQGDAMGLESRYQDISAWK